jgi:hypothetical protein
VLALFAVYAPAHVHLFDIDYYKDNYSTKIDPVRQTAKKTVRKATFGGFTVII